MSPLAGTLDGVTNASFPFVGGYGTPINVGGGLHSSFGAAGPPATMTGWLFRSMSTTVTHQFADVSSGVGGGAVVGFAQYAVVFVMFADV